MPSHYLLRRLRTIEEATRDIDRRRNPASQGPESADVRRSEEPSVPDSGKAHSAETIKSS